MLRHLEQRPAGAVPQLKELQRVQCEDALAFERVAGDVLRSGRYELLESGPTYPTARGKRELRRYAALSKSWNLSAAAYQRSPLWKRSHPVLG